MGRGRSLPWDGIFVPGTEVGMNGISIGLKEAVRLTLENIRPLPIEKVGLVDSIDRVAAAPLFSLVDSPSEDTSRKDGYAVMAHEVADATRTDPVRLRLVGTLSPGGKKDVQVTPGTAVRVLTGARIPTGATAVVSDEFVKPGDHDVLVENCAKPNNILHQGSDISCGKSVLRAGQQISPLMAGLLAVAGHTTVPVYQNPVVGIVGTGDEIVEPGKPLAEGKLYASNIITLAGWCLRYKMKPSLALVNDDPDAIARIIQRLSAETDAVITSGGAWTGDHDMVASVLERLGWTEVFHHVRMGPGKATGFGTLNGKPVFVLPGGPPSNVVGFLQIALPGLRALSGHPDPGLPMIKARLASDLVGGEAEWTDFFFGTLAFDQGLPSFHPMEKRSRMASIVKATAVASIPEGSDHLEAGWVLPVQLLMQDAFCKV